MNTSRWSWLRRVIIVLLVLANLAVVFVLWQINAVENTIETRVAKVEDVADALDPPPARSSDPLTFLVLGSDSRENLPDEWAGDFGDFGGQRADVIMLVRVVPATGRLTILSIPRDLRVTIDGYGTQKINAAYAFGGARLMVQTVKSTFGIPIHHYSEIDFVGFAGLVDELGGLTIEFDHPARDTKSGLSVEAGAQRLDGRMALAYARSRSYQEQVDGQWVSVVANDIGRTARQQELMLAILGEMRRPTNLIGVQSLVDQMAGYLTVDPAFVDLDLLSLAVAFRSLGGDDIDTMTLPTASQRIDGIWYEIPVEPDASDMIAAFSAGGGSSAAVEPVQLSVVRIENGNGRSGVAGTWATVLTDAGYEVAGIGDHATFDIPVTQIVVAEQSAAAAELAAALGFGEVVTGSPPSGVDALVVIGADAPQS